MKRKILTVVFCLGTLLLTTMFQACSKVGTFTAGSSQGSKNSREPNGSGEQFPTTPQAPPTLESTCSSQSCFFVSPTGSANNNGTIESPWDLQTALSQPSKVTASSVIWLRGGVYRGAFLSLLTGRPGEPITVVGYPRERPILDAVDPTAQNFAALTIRGSYALYRDFEVTNSSTQRLFPNSADTCFERQHCRRPGVDVFGQNVKVVNLVIHDTGVGLSLWRSATNSDAYGNIIYYSGWEGQIRGSGHGLYTQNDTGYRQITDNVIFSNFHSGIHAYGTSDATVRNITFEGNTIFGNGLLASDPNGWGILVGGNALTENIAILNNYLFNTNSYSRSNNLDPSYSSGTRGLVMRNNFSLGFKALDYVTSPSDVIAENNSFFGIVGPLPLSQINGLQNQIASNIDNKIYTFIRPNVYDSSRAVLIVFNGTASNSIEANLAPFLTIGQAYEVIDIQNLFGPPILKGIFANQAISLPLAANAPISPLVGNSMRMPEHQGGHSFAVFLIRKTE